METLDEPGAAREEYFLQAKIYVKVYAWVHLIICGALLYHCLTSIIQYHLFFPNAFDSFTDPGEEVRQHLAQMARIQWLVMQAFYLVGGFSLVAIIAAWGLLKRQNWARHLYTIAYLLLLSMSIYLGTFAYQEYYTMMPMGLSFGEETAGSWRIILLSRMLFFIFLLWGMSRALIRLNSHEIVQYLTSKTKDPI